MASLSQAIAETLRTKGHDPDIPEYNEWKKNYSAFLLDFDFKPPCACPVCQIQYRYESSQNNPVFAYLGELKSEEAAKLAKDYLQSTNTDLLYLRQAVSSHSSLILKRWRRDPKHRRTIIERAHPDMYPFRTPLIDLGQKLSTFGAGSLHEQRKHKSAYLLPYANIEDLVADPHRFIGLLHHRTQDSFASWAPFDNLTIQAAWRQGAFLETPAHGCIMMHNTGYGKWQSFKSNAVHRGEAYGTPRGLLILECQQRLMGVLRSITAVILENTKPLEVTDDTSEREGTHIRLQSEPCDDWLQYLGSGESSDQPWEKLGAIFAELPYHSAPTFDVDLLIEIAETRSSEAHDELWLLQTDLEYFHDRARYHEARWFDKVLHVGAARPYTAKEKLDNVGFVVTITAMLQARDWQWVLEECQTVQSEQRKHDGESCKMSEAYENALGSLHQLLVYAQNYHSKYLERQMLRLPEFRQVFKIINVVESTDTGKIYIFDVKDPATLYTKDRIGWCLYQLTKDESHLDKHHTASVLQHLDDWLATCSREETRRMGQEIHRSVSNLAATTQMLAIMGFHRPYYKVPEFEDLQERSPAWQTHARFIKDTRLTLSTTMRLGASISPLKKFQIPKGKKDDKWLKEWDAAHRALSSMWMKAREAYQMMLGNKAVPQEFIDSQLEMMKLCDSADSIAHRAMERQEIMDRIRAQRQLAVARKALPPAGSVNPFAAQQDDQMKYRGLEPRVPKTKTRPSETTGHNDDDQCSDTVLKSPPAAQVLYTTKPGSILSKVVALLFPAAESKPNGGKFVDWVEFVAAMKALGFRAGHAGGSAFTFKGDIRLPESPSTPQKRSIVVHRPHPETEMEPILLSGVGKRLSKWYAWERANFQISDTTD